MSTGWTRNKLHHLFENCKDVHVEPFHLDEAPSSTVTLIYCEGLCDVTLISRTILTNLEKIYHKCGFTDAASIEEARMLPIIEIDDPTEDKIIEYVFTGNLLFLFHKANALFILDISSQPNRTPEESSTEISIRGPKDGFVESIVMNVALIRKRIKSTSLIYETLQVGQRTHTTIGLLYIQDIVNPKVVEEAKKRLKKLDIDGIYGINQVETAVAGYKYSFFPLVDSTGRPDFAVNSLLSGRLVIVIDGIPTVIIGPATITMLMKSPEDIHFNYLYVSFSRIIRIVSLLLAMFLPGIWVALTTFHQDELPYSFLATITTARLGIPLSIPLEMFLFLLFLEIFREAGVRLPSSIGQTLTVVGGLIIGDAAIRAGLVSPATVVIGAITAVSGATLVNQGLSNTVSVIRLLIYIISSILGMYGFFIGLFMIVAYLARLNSFGVPYLSPMSPVVFNDLPAALLRMPWNKMKKRPETLVNNDTDRKGEKDKDKQGEKES